MPAASDAHELLALIDELLNRSEAMTRQALRSLQAGTYRHVDYLDNDGIELDRLVRIEVAVTIGDGTMTCDFTGTSPQVRGPFNCMPSGPYAAACFALRAVTDPEGRVPNNGGCFRPLAFHLPEGSLVNPREPAPTGCRTSTIKRITTCILGALRQAAPDRVPADSGSEIVILHFGGQRSDGRRYVTSQLLVSGSGASPHLDGVDVIETDASNCLNVPAEALMMEAPIRVHRVALHRDSGGPGTASRRAWRHVRIRVAGWRGHRDVPRRAASVRGSRHRRWNVWRPRQRGDPARRGRRGSREIEDRLHAAQGRSDGDHHRGWRRVWRTGGRDPALVQADLRNGKVSQEAAREFYAYRGNA